MKKVMVVFFVLVMMVTVGVMSCRTSGTPGPIDNFLCNPTPAQQQAAKVGIAIIQIAFGLGAAYFGQGQLASLVDAQKIYDRVVSGYCVTQTQWDTATAAVVEAQAVTAKDMRMKAQSANIQLLQSVKW